MSKMLFSRISLIVIPLFAIALVSSCSNKENNETNYEYLAVQMAKGDSWSIIDKDGKEVVKEEYPSDASISSINEKTYWVKTDGKYQLYNLSDPKKPVIEEEFTRATRFVSGVAVVSNPNQQIRIINTKGKTIATLGKDIKKCYEFTVNGYAIIENADDLRGIIDNKGNIVIRPTYVLLNISNDNIVWAQKNKDDKVLLTMDIKGKKLGEISTDKYELLTYAYHEEKILVKETNNNDGYLIVMDKAGKKLFNIKSKEKFMG